MSDLILEVSVRGTSLLSVLGSLYLLISILSRPSKTELAKTLIHLALVDIAAFGWEFVAPRTPCFLNEEVWKFLLGISISVELAISLGMLARVFRCQRLLRHGALKSLMVWPINGLAYVWYVKKGPSIFDPRLDICVGTQFQVSMELAFGWGAFFVICFGYLLTQCFSWLWSPSSVVKANIAYFTRFMIGQVVVTFPYGLYLIHLHEVLRGRAALNRTYYLIGHSAMCLNGLVNALVYGMYRLRGRGDNNLASFAVAFEQEEVFPVDDTVVAAMQNAERETEALEELRRVERLMSCSYDAFLDDEADEEANAAVEVVLESTLTVDTSANAAAAASAHAGLAVGGRPSFSNESIHYGESKDQGQRGRALSSQEPRSRSRSGSRSRPRSGSRARSDELQSSHAIRKAIADLGV